MVLHAFLPMIKLIVGDEILTDTSNSEDIIIIVITVNG